MRTSQTALHNNNDLAGKVFEDRALLSRFDLATGRSCEKRGLIETSDAHSCPALNLQQAEVVKNVA